MTKRHLFIIDPQNDFCDLPSTYLGSGQVPALPVKGAHQDMLRLAGFLMQQPDYFAKISVTLDSHQQWDIAHNVYWLDQQGQTVTPFTQISLNEVMEGRYRCAQSAQQAQALSYMRELEAQHKHRLIAWPVHCELGSWGHAIHADLLQALHAWELSQQASVSKILKGLNPGTEHYSALRAEVPLSDDEGTQVNQAVLASLADADEIWVAGQAASHCVAATVSDLLQYLPVTPQRSWVLLQDCMSPVSGFEDLAQSFFTQAELAGVSLKKLATNTL